MINREVINIINRESDKRLEIAKIFSCIGFVLGISAAVFILLAILYFV